MPKPPRTRRMVRWMMEYSDGTLCLHLNWPLRRDAQRYADQLYNARVVRVELTWPAGGRP